MDATMELGYDFEPTFLIAHKLYAKGLISYPYLYQNGIPGNVYNNMRRDFRVLEHNAQYGQMAKEVGRLSTRNTFHNDETPYNGHGIVTTGLRPTDLTRDEERLYNLIVKRVIEAFTPDENDFQKKSRRRKSPTNKRVNRPENQLKYQYSTPYVPKILYLCTNSTSYNVFVSFLTWI